MAARSEPSKISGMSEAPKLGNAKPSSLAASVRPTLSFFNDEPPPQLVITEASTSNPPPMVQKVLFM